MELFGQRTAAGAELRAGDQVIAEAKPTTLALDVPPSSPALSSDARLRPPMVVESVPPRGGSPCGSLSDPYDRVSQRTFNPRSTPMPGAQKKTGKSVRNKDASPSRGLIPMRLPCVRRKRPPPFI